MAAKVRALCAILIMPFLCSCVTSKEPLLGPDTRVLPWTTPKKVQVFERKSANEAWTKPRETTLVPDLNDLTIRDGDQVFSLHPIGFRRFLAQSLFPYYRYAYGVLEIRNGEGILNFLACETFDRSSTRAAGITIEGNPAECKLDTANNPLDVLLQLASRAKAGAGHRYVQVQ